MKKTEFEHGDLTKIAEEVGISRQLLTNILAGRRRMRSHIAVRCVEVAESLGYDTSPFDWKFPQESENPLFQKWKRGDE